MILWLSWATVMAGVEINSLRSKITKQQEQINELIYKHNRLIGLCKDITLVCKKIATKVIFVEEKIDKQ